MDVEAVSKKKNLEHGLFSRAQNQKGTGRAERCSALHYKVLNNVWNYWIHRKS